MDDLVQVWQPSSHEISTYALGVPWSSEKHPTRQEYEWQLESRLRELIDEDPEHAKETLSASVEHQPGLYAIATQNPAAAYPSLILQSDEMQILFSQINWNEEGQILKLERNELPSLADISEAIG